MGDDKDARYKEQREGPSSQGSNGKGELSVGFSAPKESERTWSRCSSPRSGFIRAVDKRARAGIRASTLSARVQIQTSAHA
jgi:hypothetical protein